MNCSGQLLMGQRGNQRSSNNAAGLCRAERWKKRDLGRQFWLLSCSNQADIFPQLKHAQQAEGHSNEDGMGASQDGYKTEASISSASCYHHTPGTGGMCVGQRGEQQAKVTREKFTEPSTKSQEYSQWIKITDFLISSLAYISFQCVTGEGKCVILQCSLVYPC